VDGFDEFFRTATASTEETEGGAPYGYQTRIARVGLPDVLLAPTGTGKTSIILAWLWRRLHGDPEGTPRRLVYALPQPSLVEQVAWEVARWLENLGLSGEVALHVVMGGAGEWQPWREDMHRLAIVLGTADSLVSKALNRGYGIGRVIYPIDFALVTNGAHWVIDEVRLCPESTATLRQLAAFAGKYPVAEPFGLTCMSASDSRELLVTVDNPEIRRTVEILPEERAGELAARLGARRTVRRLHVEPGDYAGIAEAARKRHRAGTLTLVVLNTVAAAQEVFRHLSEDAPAECTLLHSRFRAVERELLMRQVTEHPADRIVVSTPVVEAGIDLNAAVLITEAAPWPSVVQRAGRCNRTGKIHDAELWWVAPRKPVPYEEADVAAAAAELIRLDDDAVTGEDLSGRAVQVTRQPVTVLRHADYLDLFDTATDLRGDDIDVGPYVQDADELDAQLAWASWTPAAGSGAPPDEARSPAAEYRCRVPVGQLNEFARDRAVWRFDPVLDSWARVNPDDGRSRPGPSELLVVSAAAGGYDPVTGFDPGARREVPGCPSIDIMPEPSDEAADASAPRRDWISLDQHSRETRDQAEALLGALKPALPEGTGESVVTAAYLHDAGKAHEIWQDALCRLAAPDQQEMVDAGRPWAKSGGEGRLCFSGGVKFRHELASLLILDGPLQHLLASAPDQDLARYLVLAHHGKLRLQVRDRAETAAEEAILGLKHGATSDVPGMLGQPATRLTVDLDQFRLDGDRSWTRTVLTLRDRYGPFVLAYLETVVRMADWRASAGAALATAGPPA
jgi:CRISPR-associated endonuclease/helicase Cas3